MSNTRTLEGDASIPSFGEVLWMLFMQPVGLERRLKACGVSHPSLSAWRLWREPGPDRAVRQAYVRRMAAALVLVAISAALAYSFILRQMNLALPREWGNTLPILEGALRGVTLALIARMAMVLAGSSSIDGQDFGAEHITDGARRVGVSILVAMIAGIAAYGTNVDALAMVMGAALALARLLLYPLEALAASAFYFLERATDRPTLHLTPVLYHELSYLPHPFLLKHILLCAERDPALVRRVLDACQIAPGQRRIAREALAHLQARELESLARSRSFSAVVELSGEWLPGVEGAPDPLHAFSEVGRYFAAAEGAAVPHHKLKHLEHLGKALRSLENHLLAQDTTLSQALRKSMPIWRAVEERLLQRAKEDADGTLPNPFRPNDTLHPSHGEEVFRGREEIVFQTQSLLIDPSWSCTISLLGPRRCGKTSLLKMLAKFLPDTVCVFFDLQAHPGMSAAGLFEALADRARESARLRHLDLPALRDASSPKRVQHWLEAVETAVGDRRILLCIDEFERLEQMFRGSERELGEFMGILRSTMQHFTRVRFLISAATPFDELGRAWNDNLIGTQEIRIGHLDRSTSLALLTRPTPGFPQDTVPEEVAEAVFERTDGQPLLLQAYGFHLVALMNQEKRRAASVRDVPVVEDIVLSRYRAYFANIVQGAPAEVRSALFMLARERPVEIRPRARRWLQNRGLEQNGRLRIPVLGRWIREMAG